MSRLGKLAGVMIRLTRRQAALLDRLVDTYIDAAAETLENRRDLGLAKRIRTALRTTRASQYIAEVAARKMAAPK